MPNGPAVANPHVAMPLPNVQVIPEAPGHGAAPAGGKVGVDVSAACGYEIVKVADAKPAASAAPRTTVTGTATIEFGVPTTDPAPRVIAAEAFSVTIVAIPNINNFADFI